MPIYEYTCTECGEDFEELILNSREDVLCPNCNSEKIQKKMSVFAHKNEEGFRPSTGSSCSACTASTCTSCKK
jgi:putative FmdB family regulatory protein